MKFSKDRPVWFAAGTDDSRPVLAQVLVQRVPEYISDGQKYNGEMVAADGFILAVVPVNLDDTDVEGMVKVDVLKAAVKLATRGKTPEVTLDEDKAMLEDGTIMFRLPGGSTVNSFGVFPDYKRIVPNRRSKVRPLQFGINVEYLSRLAKAIGSPKGGVVITGGETDIQPLFIDPLAGGSTSSSDIPVAPYGVQMPMHLKNRATEVKETVQSVEFTGGEIAGNTQQLAA